MLNQWCRDWHYIMSLCLIITSLLLYVIVFVLLSNSYTVILVLVVVVVILFDKLAVILCGATSWLDP